MLEHVAGRTNTSEAGRTGLQVKVFDDGVESIYLTDPRRNWKVASRGSRSLAADRVKFSGFNTRREWVVAPHVTVKLALGSGKKTDKLNIHISLICWQAVELS